MDDADRAEMEIEREQEQIGRLHQGLLGAPERQTCRVEDCGVVLPEYRRQYGICMDCQRRIEQRETVLGGMAYAAR
jgi:hypothetical protein